MNTSQQENKCTCADKYNDYDVKGHRSDCPSQQWEEALKIEFAKWYQYGLIERGTDFVADWWIDKIKHDRQSLLEEIMKLKKEMPILIAENIDARAYVGCYNEALEDVKSKLLE